MDLLLIAAAVFALLSVVSLTVAGLAMRRKRLIGSLTSLTVALLLLALGALSAAVSVGMQGYRALTREEVAAVVETRPTGPHAFRAVVHLPDSTTRTYRLRGDQLYVDARILKWEPVVNFLGLHTSYELDRIGGRYLRIEDEREGPRTIHRLGEEKPVDLFELRSRFPLLSPLVDAEYGSATYVHVREPARLEVRVSTSGLLMRRAGASEDTAAARRPVTPPR